MQMEQILPAVLQRKVPAGAEEIRLRSGCRPLAMVDGRAVWLDEGRLTPAQIKEVVDRACRYSIHSYQDQLAQGYLTIQGGHRMGVCGQAVMQQGRVQMMRNFSSVNLRVARQIVGAAAPVYPLCFDGAAPLSVLLFSPPGYGKTTLLRDLIRRFSLAGWRVGVADERAEICAMVQGQSQFDLGEQVDVITGCPKALGAMMLLKTMSPRFWRWTRSPRPRMYRPSARWSTAACGCWPPSTPGAGRSCGANRSLLCWSGSGFSTG